MFVSAAAIDSAGILSETQFALYAFAQAWTVSLAFRRTGNDWFHLSARSESTSRRALIRASRGLPPTALSSNGKESYVKDRVSALEAFGSSIDPNASKVLNSPSLIFLCGGPIARDNEVQSSLRGLFLQRLRSHHPELCGRVLLAENANKWSKTAKHYDDLFKLEEDLAHLSAAILLFVESPGSIAELGAFCQALTLRKKLIAVLERIHKNDESFIQEGPVDLLRKSDTDSVLFYPWLGPPDECGVRHVDLAQSEDTVKELVDRLIKETSKVKKEESFDSSNDGHCILLVADIVKLGVIVKLGEIERLLVGFGLTGIAEKLERYLFLLQQLKLVDKTGYGHTDYYLSLDPPSEYIRYALKSKEQRPDRLRLQLDLNKLLEPLDRGRARAFKAYPKKTDGKHG